MKNFITLLVLGILMGSCTNSENKMVTISVLEDVTETNFIASSSFELMESKLGLSDDIWAGVRFRYGTISSLEHNKRYELLLKPEQSLTGNNLERRAKVTAFSQEVEYLLNHPKDSTVYQYSAIWEPLTEEIKMLQKDSLGVFTVYLFSDLQENNNSWFSTYSKSDMGHLKNNPQKIEQLFLEKAKAISKKASTLKVIVVYQPRNRQEDMLFKQMKQLYKAVFKELQIPIEFTANLN